MLHTANSMLQFYSGYNSTESARDLTIFSRSTPHIWASHSPDLNPPDFFLWGYTKDRVYVNKPRDIDELKEAVTDVIRGISADATRNVIAYFAVRVRECLIRAGAHIEPVL